MWFSLITKREKLQKKFKMLRNFVKKTITSARSAIAITEEVAQEKFSVYNNKNMATRKKNHYKNFINNK